ncbi:hypothetical protein BH09SUM1_BH09SUM1_03280 [soil metagenome]
MGLFDKFFGKKDQPSVPEDQLGDETIPLTGPSWQVASNVPQELAASEVLDLYNRQPRPVFLDVREEEERRQFGFIPGSLHIPMHDIQGRMDELDPKKFVVVYCASGMRSMDAGAFLLEQGFREVGNLNGGMGKWEGPTEMPN